MSRRGSNQARRLRLPAVVVLVCVTVGLLTATASAGTLPPEGVFENCSLAAQMPTCVQRLQVMHQGGLQVVAISATSGSPAALQSYAQSAQSLGMSVMWELGDPNWWRDPPSSTSMAGTYSAFASLCGCNQNGPLLAYLVHWLSQLPATYGYYAADDSMLAPGDQAGVAAYVDQIKQQDQGRTVMIGSAAQSQTATYQPISDLVGTEIYPVTTDPLTPISANQAEWSSVGQWAADAQQSADQAGKQSAFILQAFTWGDNLSDGQAIGACSPGDTPFTCYSKLRYPSSAEQLELRNETLLHAHPKLILWWSFPGTYGDVTGNTYSIFPSGGDASGRWSGLEAAVQAPLPGAGASPGASSPSHRVTARLARTRRQHGAHHARRRHHRRRHHRRHKKRA